MTTKQDQFWTITKLDSKSGTKSVPNNPDAKTYPEQLHYRFVVVTIDEASNNLFWFVKNYLKNSCLKLVWMVILQMKDILRFQLPMEKIVNANITYCKKTKIHISDNDKTLLLKY